jgi:hypothetical protein
MEAVPIARYLRPEEQVVPFWDRPELGELVNWCSSGKHAAVRLVTGEGGVGKTRLALRLCQKLDAVGWQPLWVSPGLEGEVVGAVRELGTPCVAVVDYAETRDQLAAFLDEVASDLDGPDLRIVMLARSSGEWWRSLISHSGDGVSRLLTAPPTRLGPLPTKSDQREVFEIALAAFAEKLRVDCPDASLELDDPTPSVLVVHAAALLAVVNHSQGYANHHIYSTSEVLAELLSHEGRYWAKSASARNLHLDLSVLAMAVMAGSLIGAGTELAAADLMGSIPDLSDSAVLRGQVARWLHDLYPESGGTASGGREWIGSLRPDRIAEYLVVTELSRRPELVSRLFCGLSRYRAIHGRSKIMM